MSEEDLEVLITLDDPGEDALEEDTFHDSQAGNTVERSIQRAQVIVDDDSSKLGG